MALCNTSTKLSDILIGNPGLIAVANRLGINLGVGSESLGEAAERIGINKEFLLAVINSYLHEGYFPKEIIPQQPAVEYLKISSRYYRDIQLPNIDRHFQPLLRQSGPSNNLSLLRGFYESIVADMETSIEFDLNETYVDGNLTSAKERVEQITKVSENVQDKLEDLLHFFIVSLKGNFNANLCTAVVTSLYNLLTDIRLGNRIRRKILIPSINSKE